MAAYPRRGEHYRRKNVPEPWTVFILGVKFNDDVFSVNPEFYCEVKFIYESSGEYTEMPLDWFRDAYRKISSGGEYIHCSGNQRGTTAPDYSWLNDDDK